MNHRLIALKNSLSLFVFIFLAWGLYRQLFKLPEEVEELIIKPLIWLGATAYFVRREKKNLESVGITMTNIFPAIYFAIALGLIFAVEGFIVNFVKYGGFNFMANIGDKTILASLPISFATAISEEVAFRGYIFNRTWMATGKEWWSNVVTSVGWSVIHIPVVVFVWKLSLDAAIVYLLLTFIFGLGASFVFARTKNVFSSIFLHVLWEWPIILFR